MIYIYNIMNVNNISNFIQDKLSVVDNNVILNSVIGLFLALYGGLAAPKLPRSIAKLFDYTIVKLIAFFLLAYLASKDKGVAIVASVALIVTLQTLSKYKLMDKLSQLAKQKIMGQQIIEEQPVSTDSVVAVSDELIEQTNEVNVEQQGEQPVEQEYLVGYEGHQHAEVPSME